LTSIQTSVNGINWTSSGSNIPQPVFTIQGHRSAYSPRHDIWIAVGEGTDQIATNLGGDDSQWSGHSQGQVFGGGGIGWGVAYGSVPNRWVIVGKSTLGSPLLYGDPVNDTYGYVQTWSTNVNGSIFLDEGRDVAYGSSRNMFVAVGVPGASVMKFISIYSFDGLTWNILGNTGYPSNIFGNAIIVVGDYFLFAVQQQGYQICNVSANLNPQTITSTFLNTGTVWDIEYANGLWLATGKPNDDTRIIETSTNGFTQTRLNVQFPPLNGFGTGISYSVDLGLWVLSGVLMKPYYSYDGLEWFQGTATTQIFNHVQCRSNLPLPLAPTLSGITTVETSIIKTGETSTLSGTLFVTGSFYIDGQFNLTGNQSSAIVNNTLVLGNQSALVLVIDYPLASNMTVVIEVAQYRGSTGSFRSISVVAQSACDFANEPNYGSSTLAVTVQVSSCRATSDDTAILIQTGSGGLPLGAIIGIAVGCSVLAAAVIVLFVYFMKKRTLKHDKLTNQGLAAKEIQSLRNINVDKLETVAKPSPSVLL